MTGTLLVLIASVVKVVASNHNVVATSDGEDAQVKPPLKFVPQELDWKADVSVKTQQ